MRINSTHIWLGISLAIFVIVAVMIGVAFGQAIPVQIQGSSSELQPAKTVLQGSPEQLQNSNHSFQP